MGRLPTEADFPDNVKLAIVPRKCVNAVPFFFEMKILWLRIVSQALSGLHSVSGLRHGCKPKERIRD